MKIRESGMPERAMWEQLFDPQNILVTLGVDKQTTDVAEFGCGYSTFTIPAAKIIKGKIYAFDIEPDMIRLTKEEAEKQGLSNVETIQRDFIAEGSGLPDESVDYVMLFNILHLEGPVVLLTEAWRILKDAGRVGIIHWNYDPKTPRGPSMEIRPRPYQCIEWATRAGFADPKQFDLKPHHYGIVMSKKVGVGEKEFPMKILKHLFYFVSGLSSVYVGILLLAEFLPPPSLFWTRLVALLPLIIPGTIGILLWKRSWAFTAGVGIWILYMLIVWSKV